MVVVRKLGGQEGALYTRKAARARGVPQPGLRQPLAENKGPLFGRRAMR